MKVSELEGAELDYWVLKSLGYNEEQIDRRIRRKVARPAEPSSDWADGGPLIEEKRITVAASETECFMTEPYEEWWTAWSEEVGVESIQIGGTPLEAACRAVVASVYGEEVPDAP